MSYLVLYILLINLHRKKGYLETSMEKSEEKFIFTKFKTMEDGLSVQMMHLGFYDARLTCTNAM
jgi:hypothetical protein